MNRLTIFLLIIFFLITFAACGVGANLTQEKKPDPFFWDFGRVKDTDILEHIFTLSNDTKEPWVIQNLVTSCGCTASTISTQIIAPGESAEIKVTFNAKGYRNKVQQHVFIHTNRSDNPVIQLTIQAEVSN